MLLVVAVAVAVRTYLPHIGHPFPLHADELYVIWSGSTLARDGVFLVSPDMWHETFINSIWPGFDWHHAGVNGLYGVILRMTGGDPFRTIAVLPAWFAGLSSFAAGVLVTRVTRSFFLGSVSTALWGFLRSDAFVLGIELFVASTVALLLSILLFLFLETVREQRRPVVLFGLLLVVIRFYYHFSTAIVVVVVSFLVLMIALLKRSDISGSVKWSVALCPLPFILVGLLACWDVLASGRALELVELLRFPFSERSHTPLGYSLGQMIGIVPMILAFLGVAWSFRKNRLRACAIGFLVVLTICKVAPLLNATYTARYGRLFYESQVFAVPLAGLGLYAIGEVAKYVARNRRWISGAVLGCLMMLLVVERSLAPEHSRYWRYMDERTHRSLLWMDSNIPRDDRIMALPSDALLLRALGFGTTDVLPLSADPDSSYTPILDFFRPEASEAAMRYSREQRPSVVFSRSELIRPGLEEIARPDGQSLYHFVYRFTAF
jgi:hypothetical protein